MSSLNGVSLPEDQDEVRRWKAHCQRNQRIANEIETSGEEHNGRGTIRVAKMIIRETKRTLHCRGVGKQSYRKADEEMSPSQETIYKGWEEAG